MEKETRNTDDGAEKVADRAAPAPYSRVRRCCSRCCSWWKVLAKRVEIETPGTYVRVKYYSSFYLVRTGSSNTWYARKLGNFRADRVPF